MDHLKARQRSEEVTVGMDYLSNLHQLHEQWFCPSENTVKEGRKSTVLVIDGNRTEKEVFEDAKAQIQNFLDSKRMS
jgi:hypothetical protein